MPTALEPVANVLCLDFANTVNRRPHPTRDLLLSGDDARAWTLDVGVQLGSAHPSARQLTSLRELRACVTDAFDAVVAGCEPSPDTMEELVGAYASALSRARWRRDGARLVAGWDQPDQGSTNLADSVAGSAMDLLLRGPLERVGVCPSCRWLFFDTSRNGQRRWCSMTTCGSRMKAARHYSRSRSTS